MSEFWGKQPGYMMQKGKMCEQEKPMGCFKPCEREKKMEYPKPCECEKPKEQPKPCYPPMPCEDKPCHCCGYAWRKCPCCGKCCCCKVWNCGGYYVYECSECGEVFWTSCEEECYKK